MADEPVVQQGDPAAPVVEEPQPTPTPEPTPVATPDPKDVELAAARERLTRYEQMVVSPEYAEFLASKAAQKVTQAQPKQYTDAEKQAFIEKLNGMSRAEYAAFIRDITVDQVRTQLVAPVVQTIVTEKVQAQINAAAAKHADFWDYQKEMTDLARANPALTAEQAYHLAKASKTPNKPAAQGSPRPSGEPPSSPPAARREAPIGKFEDAFEKAFKKAGL